MDELDQRELDQREPSINESKASNNELQQDYLILYKLTNKDIGSFITDFCHLHPYTAFQYPHKFKFTGPEKEHLCLIKNKIIIYQLPTQEIAIRWALACTEHIRPIFNDACLKEFNDFKRINEALDVLYLSILNNKNRNTAKKRGNSLEHKANQLYAYSKITDTALDKIKRFMYLIVAYTLKTLQSDSNYIRYAFSVSQIASSIASSMNLDNLDNDFEGYQSVLNQELFWTKDKLQEIINKYYNKAYKNRINILDKLVPHDISKKIVIYLL